MGIFTKESPFDGIVEKATLDTNTKEDWALILDICDKVGSSTHAPKECLRAIVKRLNHQDPHVAIQAATLLDACVSNCGQSFHLEIASREFEQEYRKIISKATEKPLRDKLLGLLEKWATNEFKSSPQLDLIPTFYNKLKSNGFSFPNSDSPSKGKKGPGSSAQHHNHKAKGHGGASVVASAAQQEADDLAKAIELSLKETQNSPKTKSLYPQAVGLMGTGAGNTQTSSVPEPRRVRALYDFEAAEDNELTFYAGEIVHVLDDSDANWWQGSNQRGNGLFPSNFVTADLSAETPKLESSGHRKSVQFNDEVEVKTVECEPEVVQIDEAKLDRVLHLLNEADTNGEIPDPPELAVAEDQVNQMGPLIDTELEKIDRRHAQLTRLGSELVDALNMYHHLMRPTSIPAYDPRYGPPPPISAPPGPGYGPGPLPGPPQHYSPMPNHMPPPPWTAPPVSSAPYYVQSPAGPPQYANVGHHPGPPVMMGSGQHGVPAQNGYTPHQVLSAPPHESSAQPQYQGQHQMGPGHMIPPMSHPTPHQNPQEFAGGYNPNYSQ